MGSGLPPVKEVTEWAAQHLSISLGSRAGFACHIDASAVLPLSAAQAYELLTHPDNAAIFRGIDLCSYRHILQDDGCERLLVEVENVSVWRLLFFSGRIATRLLVHQDYHSGTMRMQLAPDPTGQGPHMPGCKQVPLEKMEACWSIRPLSECVEEARAILPDIPPEQADRIDEHYCFVRLEQSVQPWGIPRFFYGAFNNVAKAQAQQTFEDVLAEAFRIRAGFPSLCPYEEACKKEIRPADALLLAETDGQCQQQQPAEEAEEEARTSDPAQVGGAAALAAERPAHAAATAAARAALPAAAAAAAALGTPQQGTAPLQAEEGEGEEEEASSTSGDSGMAASVASGLQSVLPLPLPPTLALPFSAAGIAALTAAGVLAASRRPGVKGHPLADWDVWEAEAELEKDLWEASERDSSLAGSYTPLGGSVHTPLLEEYPCGASEAGSSDVGAVLSAALALAAARAGM
ncbi:hypothetical protein N2152v2_001735 [Parachlorella kessleri]